MKIFVDADSCPRAARDIVLRAAQRTGVKAFFAANRAIPGIPGPGESSGESTAEMLIFPPGDNSADNGIAALARPGDLAVTRDIPLASRLVEAGIAVLDDRGRIYTTENIRERLSLRNFTVGLAESGLDFERTANSGKKELKAFADSFDRLLAKLLPILPHKNQRRRDSQ
jgi:uncharacterized protein YaiI (UPF0178 family)